MAALNAVNDVLIHVKTKEESGIVEKKEFPITRWENILGAPHIATATTLPDMFASEYLLYVTGDVYLSDYEYYLCFGDLANPDARSLNEEEESEETEEETEEVTG